MYTNNGLKVKSEDTFKYYTLLFCHACLTPNRTLTMVGDYVDIYLKICDNVRMDVTSQVALCSECMSMLRKILAFRIKVQNAQQILNYCVNNQAQPRGLTSLTQTWTQTTTYHKDEPDKDQSDTAEDENEEQDQSNTAEDENEEQDQSDTAEDENEEQDQSDTAEDENEEQDQSNTAEDENEEQDQSDTAEDENEEQMIQIHDAKGHNDLTFDYRPHMECMVSGALARLLRVSTRVGVCPLRFTRTQKGWLLAVSSPLAAVQRVVMTVLNLVMLTALIMDFCLEPERRIRVGETTLKAFVWISDMVLMMVIASIAVYMGPSRMESLIQVQNQLKQASVDLKITEPSARSEKLRSIGIFAIVIWAILLLTADFYSFLELSIHEGKMWSIMCMYSTYYIGNLMGLLVVLQWSCSVLAVHATAIALNDELYRLRHANIQCESSATLEDLSSSPKSERNNLVDSFTRRKVNREAETFITLLEAQTTIRRLALTHERISELTRQMNANNGIFLLVVLLSTFLRLVLTPYYLLLRFEFDEREEWNVTETLLQINWSIFHIMVLLLTIEPCHRAQEQMERTQILLSQLIVHLVPKCERLSKELDQFAKQILLSNATFTPLGVYPLARPLMATILGGVMTYLVIIIQFQKISSCD